MPLVNGVPCPESRDAWPYISRYEAARVRHREAEESARASIGAVHAARDEMQNAEQALVEVIKTHGAILGLRRVYHSDGFRLMQMDVEFASSIQVEGESTLDGYGGETADELLNRLKAQGEAEERQLLQRTTKYRPVERTELTTQEA